MDYFIWSKSKIPSWYYSQRWMYYQKTNARVVCYISKRMFDGYNLQLYRCGDLGICDIEYRSHDLNELVVLADEWLVTYADGNIEDIHNHYYSPHNPEGYWVVEYPYRHQRSMEGDS